MASSTVPNAQAKILNNQFFMLTGKLQANLANLKSIEGNFSIDDDWMSH